MTNKIPEHWPAMKRAYELTVEQGEQSADEWTCLYRGPRGLKCAVGQLIPDDGYVPEMETRNYLLKDVLAVCGVEPTYPAVRDFNLLQGAHDFADGDDFRAKFVRRVKSHLPEFYKWATGGTK